MPWGGLSSKAERMPLHTPRHPRHKYGGCVLRLSAELSGSGTELAQNSPTTSAMRTWAGEAGRAAWLAVAAVAALAGTNTSARLPTF